LILKFFEYDELIKGSVNGIVNLATSLPIMR